MFSQITYTIRNFWFRQMTGTWLSQSHLSNLAIRAQAERSLWSKRLTFLKASARLTARRRRQAARQTQIARWHRGPESGGVLAIAAVVTLLIGASFVYAATGPKDYSYDAPTYQNDAGDKPRPREKAEHIAHSNVRFSITFSGCEENVKKHWSCSYQDAAGDTHWMYIPDYNSRVKPD